MKLAHPDLSQVLELDKPCVNCLVIENQALFYKLGRQLLMAEQGLEGAFVLSLRGTPQPFAKHAELISDPVSFTLNRKSLLTKLMTRLEQNAMDEEHYAHTQQLLSSLEAALEDWAFSLPCGINASKLSVSALIKAFGVELRDDCDGEASLAEALLDYMELVRELDRDKLFIFLNLRAFVPDDELQRFFATAIGREQRLLLIDSSSHPLLQGEKRITVDADLCEF